MMLGESVFMTISPTEVFIQQLMVCHSTHQSSDVFTLFPYTLL